MAIQKTQAFLIKSWPFRETSLLVNFFTRDFGKIKGLIKGFRTEPFRFGSRLEFFSLNHIVFYEKKSELQLVTQCDLEENFNPLRQDIEKATLANYFLELLDLVTPLHEKNEALFSLAYQALKTIEGSLNREIITRTFEIKLLKLSGFRPQLDQCVHCQKEAEGAARFSLRLGGLLCENDFVCDRSARLISKGTLASLKHLEKSAWPVSLNLKTTLSVGEELKQLLEEFLNYHLERRPKSLQFLKKMGSGTTLPASLLQRVPDPSLSTSKAKNSLQTDAFC